MAQRDSIVEACTHCTEREHGLRLAECVHRSWGRRPHFGQYRTLQGSYYRRSCEARWGEVSCEFCGCYSQSGWRGELNAHSGCVR